MTTGRINQVSRLRVSISRNFSFSDTQAKAVRLSRANRPGQAPPPRDRKQPAVESVFFPSIRPSPTRGDRGTRKLHRGSQPTHNFARPSSYSTIGKRALIARIEKPTKAQHNLLQADRTLGSSAKPQQAPAYAVNNNRPPPAHFPFLFDDDDDKLPSQPTTHCLFAAAA